MTLNPMCEHVETAQGVPLTVTGVAQCKIMTDKELLRTASEQFLGKTSQEVQLTILQTLEGHLRAILGTLSVEEVRLMSRPPKSDAVYSRNYSNVNVFFLNFFSCLLLLLLLCNQFSRFSVWFSLIPAKLPVYVNLPL